LLLLLLLLLLMAWLGMSKSLAPAVLDDDAMLLLGAFRSPSVGFYGRHCHSPRDPSLFVRTSRIIAGALLRAPDPDVRFKTRVARIHILIWCGVCSLHFVPNVDSRLNR